MSLTSDDRLRQCSGCTVFQNQYLSASTDACRGHVVDTGLCIIVCFCFGEHLFDGVCFAGSGKLYVLLANTFKILK